MKQIYKAGWCARILLSLLLATGAFYAEAYDFEVDGIYYNVLSNTEVELTYETSSYNSYSGAIVIPETVSYNGVSYLVTRIGDEAFYDSTGLTSVEIPNSVTNIGGNAFAWCRNLTNVVIGNSVTEIGGYAFDVCNSLTKVNITDLAKWCEINFDSKASNPIFYSHNLYVNNELITDLVIPSSVTSIGNYAFSGCTGLTSVEIPNSVTEIGGDAFYECSGLTKVNITDLAKWCEIKFIGDYNSNPIYCSHNIYVNNELITDLVIPSSVTSIGNYAFSGCTGLTSVEIPNSVTEIGRTAFFFCTGLTSVEIPNSVTSIGSSAFNNCTSLTKVNIPNSVTSIGDGAFAYCSSLKGIVIPNSVTEIGYDTFFDCPSLIKCAYPTSISNPFSYGFIFSYPANDSEIEDGIIYNKDKSALWFVPWNYEGNLNIPNSVLQLEITLSYIAPTLSVLK